MDLTFGGSCTYRTPGNQITDILWGDGVEYFVSAGQSDTVDVEQEFSRQSKSFVDILGFVEIWVVDKSFPTDRGARFFEIYSHYDEDFVLNLIGNMF